MFKDPLHKEEAPYDILGIGPDASQKQIHDAFQRFIKDRKNIPILNKGMDAARKLKTPDIRIAFDIFYYPMGKMDGIELNGCDVKNKLDEFLVIPYVKDDDVYSDLKKENYLDDFKEIKFDATSLDELISYDNIKQCRPEIMPFDK